MKNKKQKRGLKKDFEFIENYVERGQMRRTIISVIFLCLFISSSAYCEVKIDHDEFDGSTTIRSKIGNVGPWTVISFICVEHNCVISFIKEHSDWWFFEDARIKIDGEIYELSTVDTESDVISAYSLITAGLYSFPSKIINKIFNAKTITVRVDFRNQRSITWDVPYHVLSEWKDVIKKDKKQQ